MSSWKYLQFFDKNGKNYNFDYDESLDKWTGEVYLSKVSTNLFEVGQIFILQEMINSNTGVKMFGYPHDSEVSTSATGITGADGGWNLDWKETTPTEFKIFQFDENYISGVDTSLDLTVSDGPDIEFIEDVKIILDYEASQTINTAGYLETSEVRSAAVQINVCFSASVEDTFRRTLIIRDLSTNLIVAEIVFYGESVAEDERLKVLTENFGYSVLENDTTVFKNTDINEALPNYIEINTKRKEMMLEGHNIYPFIGSYKGLINAIKFFGYDNLRIKEFWKNVNKNSPQFGKYIHSSPISAFSPTVDFNDNSITLPNKNFRKTSMFSLIYDINQIKEDLFNSDDFPVTEETSDFTTEEVVIKLFGLKRKLEHEFLPLNAHIKDIIGEADFFGGQELSNTFSRNETNSIKSGVNVDFCIEPSTDHYIRDLRDFQLSCIDTDTAVTKAALDLCNSFIADVPTGTPQNLIAGPYSSGDELPKPPIGPSFYGTLGDPVGGQSVTVDEIADLFVAYFTEYAPNLNRVLPISGRQSESLPDAPDIPIGAPVVLKNCTYENITWDNSDTIWNSLSSQETGIMYKWATIDNRNFIDIEWTITKEEDETPAYSFNVKGSYEDYKRLPIILPYYGDYSIEMKVYDVYNNISVKSGEDVLTVDPKEVEFSGWYQGRKSDYTWEDDGTYSWNDYGSIWNLPIEPSVSWDDETVSLYGSLDRINAILNNFGINSTDNIQLLNYQSDGSVSFSGPYTWGNLNEGGWDDTYHLWWDMTSTSGESPANFKFEEVVSDSYLKIVDMNGNVGLEYLDSNVSTLAEAAAVLNLSSDKIINKYIYNVVYNAAEQQMFIQAVSRYSGVTGDFQSVDFVTYSGDRICAPTGSGSSTGCESLITESNQSINSNPTWSTAKFINNGVTLPKMSWAMFSYDKCKISGKDKPKWIIKNTTNSSFTDIYFEGKYLTFLFKTSGKYSISLELKDSNGNKYIKERNLIIIK